MKNRRAFLKQAGALTVLSPLMSKSLPSSPVPNPASAATSSGEDQGHLGFKPHWMKQADGKGGWVLRPAEIQLLHWDNGKLAYNDPKFKSFCPFGVAQMDNGEVVLIGCENQGEWGLRGVEASGEKRIERPAIAFSRDRGESWTKLKRIENAVSRPVMLTYLGKGNLRFHTQIPKRPMQYFSSDYGRTWPERKPLQLPPNGGLFHGEGNPLVDRDAKGVATRIAAGGWNFRKGHWPGGPSFCFLRWSRDGGRTWTNEIMPKEWRWQEEYQGKSYTRSVGESSFVRAANGWLVASLRTHIPPPLLHTGNDNLCGTAISISKDEGKTWSAPQVLYESGRQHGHLLRMPNGVIVLTHIMRQDVQGGRLASYRRGCGAIISRDNGQTWDMGHRYLLDDFEFADGTPWAITCGHLYSTLLDDGHILTAYGNYPAKGACLIRWKPTAA